MSERTYIDLTDETLEQEHICCIIRKKKPHSGIEAKRQWVTYSHHLCDNITLKWGTFP